MKHLQTLGKNLNRGDLKTISGGNMASIKDLFGTRCTSSSQCTAPCQADGYRGGICIGLGIMTCRCYA
ncbi:hypothetical protein [Chitinophaga nivalis]|uniref:Invertebrate defensins family profile domain-containing protein n=1 Tax=Chitinophaga nivalis TaxID=2991709 RepID=A0ABT3IUR0_9BACT|nr:hypothetical protein [Chitinophaga nivalis]MCW3462587.1 hypothetical protein [Chitinophaga nivalis]MCW3487722.1 hypothetical protein [Chitinophaga nivalis]